MSFTNFLPISALVRSCQRSFTASFHAGVSEEWPEIGGLICTCYNSRMNEINYITGDATQPDAEGKKIIVHVCNDIGGWGKGFVLALSKRWKQPEAEYRRWHNGDDDRPFELGQVQFVPVESDLWVANLIGQRGIRRSGGKPPVRYDAIKAGLDRVSTFAEEHQASVHMPRIGCGLAGGSWDEIEPLIIDTLIAAGVSVTVYDFG